MVSHVRAAELHAFTAPPGKSFASAAGSIIRKEIVYELPNPGGSEDLSLERYMLASANQDLATVDGWPINLPTLDVAVDAIAAAAARGECFSVFTLNLDHLVKLRSSAAFREAYSNATFVTADGEPVARIARRIDARIERTTGADLVVPLAEEAALRGLPVYFFGTSPGALARAASDLCERTDQSLDIAGSTSPSRDFDPEGPEADAVLDKIAASGARLCFVALGAPKQELFSAYAAKRGINVGFVCVGAALDFLAGEQVRAPAFMRRNGIEWLWRLATSPRRLTARYLKCAFVLADITFLAQLRGTLAGMRLAD